MYVSVHTGYHEYTCGRSASIHIIRYQVSIPMYIYIYINTCVRNIVCSYTYVCICVCICTHTVCIHAIGTCTHTFRTMLASESQALSQISCRIYIYIHIFLCIEGSTLDAGQYVFIVRDPTGLWMIPTCPKRKHSARTELISVVPVVLSIGCDPTGLYMPPIMYKPQRRQPQKPTANML